MEKSAPRTLNRQKQQRRRVAVKLLAGLEFSAGSDRMRMTLGFLNVRIFETQ